MLNVWRVISMCRLIQSYTYWSSIPFGVTIKWLSVLRCFKSWQSLQTGHQTDSTYTEKADDTSTLAQSLCCFWMEQTFPLSEYSLIRQLKFGGQGQLVDLYWRYGNLNCNVDMWFPWKYPQTLSAGNFLFSLSYSGLQTVGCSAPLWLSPKATWGCSTGGN